MIVMLVIVLLVTRYYTANIRLKSMIIYSVANLRDRELSWVALLHCYNEIT